VDHTSPQVDAPIWLASDRPEFVIVTDPTHPLYGRRFRLLSATNSAGGCGQLLVVYRDGVVVKIRATATNLLPTPSSLPVSKLSTESIRDLVRAARMLKHAEQQQQAGAHLPDRQPEAADLHGVAGGEP